MQRSPSTFTRAGYADASQVDKAAGRPGLPIELEVNGEAPPPWEMIMTVRELPHRHVPDFLLQEPIDIWMVIAALETHIVRRIGRRRASYDAASRYVRDQIKKVEATCAGQAGETADPQSAFAVNAWNNPKPSIRKSSITSKESISANSAAAGRYQPGGGAIDRSADSTCARAQCDAVMPEVAPGAIVSVQGGSVSIRSHGGRFRSVGLNPNQAVAVKLQFPADFAGQAVSVLALDGGLILPGRGSNLASDATVNLQ